MLFVLFFFFSSRRRHTRLTCDWSSDVCSSDLGPLGPAVVGTGIAALTLVPTIAVAVVQRRRSLSQPAGRVRSPAIKIGRASCRERGEISGVAGSLKKKKKKT